MLHLFSLPEGQEHPQLPTKGERMKHIMGVMLDQLTPQLPMVVAPFLKNFFPHLLEEITDEKADQFIESIRKVVDYIDDFQDQLQAYQDDETAPALDTDRVVDVGSNDRNERSGNNDPSV